MCICVAVVLRLSANHAEFIVQREFVEVESVGYWVVADVVDERVIVIDVDVGYKSKIHSD